MKEVPASGNVTVTYKDGQLIDGRYRIVRTLGRGAVGTVFLATDEQLDGQLLAVKIPHPHIVADSKNIHRFRKEIQLNRQLTHPGIVRLYQSAQLTDGSPYFTMEYVRGCNLSELRQQFPNQKIPAAEVCFILRRLLEALSFAHHKGVVHRDVKPDNVLFGLNGSVKLSDFGVAYILYENQDFTSTGEIIGTPTYMAPEQFQGAPVTAQGDLYSVGVLGYELLCGHPPFRSDSYIQLAKKHLLELPAKAPLAEAAVPADLQDVLTRLLEKDPQSRYQSAQEAITAIEEGSGAPLERTMGGIAAIVQSRAHSTSGIIPLRIIINISVVLILLFIIVTAGDEKRLRAEMSYDLLLVEQTLGIRIPFIDRPFKLFRPTSVDDTAFFKALETEGIESIPVLLKLGLQPNVWQQTDPLRNSFMHHAVAAKSEIVYVSLTGDTRTEKADCKKAELRNSHGDTLLHWSIRKKSRIAFNLLYKAPCALHTPNKAGETPLLLAINQHEWEMVQNLLSYSPMDLGEDAIDNEGLTAAHRIVDSGDPALLYALYKRNSKIDIRDIQGRNPLLFLLTRPWNKNRWQNFLFLQSKAPQAFAAVDNAGRDFEWHYEQADERWKNALAELHRTGTGTEGDGT